MRKILRQFKQSLFFVVDTWDGPDDEPIIFHGYTLTSRILFRDVLDAIKQYAFRVSQ